MQLLDELITAAVQLAGDDAVSHGARLWKSEGGRACPLGWEGCSQPVYVDQKKRASMTTASLADPGTPTACGTARTACNHARRTTNDAS